MRWAIFTVVLIASVTFFGYVFYRARGEQAANAAQTDIPYNAVTPDDIVDTFATNTIAAEKQYGHPDGGILVVGVAERVSRDTRGRPWLEMRTHDGALTLQAEFLDATGLESIEPGRRVGARCVFGQLTPKGNVALMRCALADLGRPL